MIYIIGISIALFLSFILISKKGRTVADSVLLAWLIVTAIHISLYYHHITDYKYAYPHLLGTAIPIPLLHGPFLFLYTIALTQPSYFKNYKWLLHFAPALGIYMYLTRIFILPADEKIWLIQNKGVGYELFFSVMGVLINLSGFVYVIWSSILLKRHKKHISQQFSYTERINLDWLRYLIYGLFSIWILVILGNDEWIFSASVLFVIFIGYFGIKQVGIFTYTDKFIPPQYEPISSDILNDFDKGSIESEEISKRKYQKSGLTDEQADTLKSNLAALMQSEKLYKNSELTLADLALKLDVSPNYLSQVINEKEGKNFYDYINTLRIEEFKILIADPKNQKYTLLALAYECGFNSKTSFNRHFKKITGKSPSEYTVQQKLLLNII